MTDQVANMLGHVWWPSIILTPGNPHKVVCDRVAHIALKKNALEMGKVVQN